MKNNKIQQVTRLQSQQETNNTLICIKQSERIETNDHTTTEKGKRRKQEKQHDRNEDRNKKTRETRKQTMRINKEGEHDDTNKSKHAQKKNHHQPDTRNGGI